MSTPFPISHAIVYSGAINSPQATNLKNQLAFLNQPQSQNAPFLPTTGLLIVLSSFGGNTFEARSIYGLIRSLPFPVDIHVVGVVQSAAVPLMLAADRRTSAPDTTSMFHPWTWGSDPHPGRTVDELEQFPMRLRDDLQWGANIIDERSGLKHADIKKLGLFESGQIVDAGFALKHGLVHHVAERKIPPGIMTWNIS